MMKQIPIMWTVIKMCVTVFVAIATTFIVANLIQGEGHQFWFTVFDKTITITVTSWGIINIGSIISAIILGIYLVKMALIFKQSRQRKQRK